MPDVSGTGPEESFLAAYNPADHPPFAVTADLALLAVERGELFVLTRRRASHPFEGRLGLPSGFLGETESAGEAAERIAREKTGLGTSVAVEQLKTYTAPDRDPRMRVVSVAHVGIAATMNARLPKVVADGQTQWTRCADLKGAEMAFDHAEILEDAIERIASRMEFTLVAARFLPEAFTLSQIRMVYAAVWGVDLDPGNFQRKILASGTLEETGERYLASGGRGAPAKVYRPRVTGDPLRPAFLSPPLRRA
ncbi:NUDIX hydrolase [Falsarthrobacter nasiphocae]|uniref:8-oxo-dGTP diphosphatase n=1 Tax=Falsarthrobacter nasiphocae TaxID=189863 RepID=A0AAE4C5S7_9MICC|nr:NUDIX domain-containing protein [Falsarthrobacter nasiphocae]MDR6891788.1 8-oxo-dGTP diphosphatase [Falsarthrobacter nasiphocae]